MISGKILFDQPVKKWKNMCKYVRKTVIDIWLCKSLIIRLSKCFKKLQTNSSRIKVLGADLKAIQQINFTGNLDRARNKNIFRNYFENKLYFSQKPVRELWFCF